MHTIRVHFTECYRYGRLVALCPDPIDGLDARLAGTIPQCRFPRLSRTLLLPRWRNEYWHDGKNSASPHESMSYALTGRRGTSMKARPRPTAGQACTMCGHVVSKTSTCVSAACRATVFRARVAGIAMDYPWKLRS